MKQYQEALRHVLQQGELTQDRTGVGTISTFGYQMRFDLKKEFPAVTTKKLAWRAVVGELLWFLEGSSDERRLAEITFEAPREELIDKKTIWTANADNQGKSLGYRNTDLTKLLGPVYGVQWRNFDGVDQIQQLIEDIQKDPSSRRHIISAWNPPKIPEMALPPCHTMAQFKVTSKGLSCQLYQRSADMFLGVPFNIASYSLLTHIIAELCGLPVDEFIWTGGDCHIYSNHVDQVQELLKREPLRGPRLLMPEIETLSDVLDTKPSQYILENYEHLPAISAPMAV